MSDKERDELIRQGHLQIVDAIERRWGIRRTAVLRDMVRDLGRLYPEVHRELCRLKPDVRHGVGTSVAGTDAAVMVTDGGREDVIPERGK